MHLKKLLISFLLVWFISPIFAASTPSLDHLDYEIKSSIEISCSYERTQGAAQYIKCLKSELSKLGNQKMPSLDHLDYEIKSSIEISCSYERTQGAAQYIKCLNNQLKELNSISDSPQNTKGSSQKASLSYKDMKLTDAINYIQNGESHQIWLSLASDGLGNAEYILGVLYIRGLGVSKSMKEAAYWINLARQNGSMDISYEADEIWNEFELWKYE